MTYTTSLSRSPTARAVKKRALNDVRVYLMFYGEHDLSEAATIFQDSASAGSTPPRALLRKVMTSSKEIDCSDGGINRESKRHRGNR